MLKQEQLFIFTLDDNQKIVITLEENAELLDPYVWCMVTFDKDNQQYPLCENFPLNIFLLTFQTLLKKSLANILPLDQSLTQDIGYLWN